MAADLVRPPKHMLEAQLCGRNERKHNHKMDCKLENREEKKKESFDNLTVSGKGHHSAVIDVQNRPVKRLEVVLGKTSPNDVPT
jgi:hypothetical protein